LFNINYTFDSNQRITRFIIDAVSQYVIQTDVTVFYDSKGNISRLENMAEDDEFTTLSLQYNGSNQIISAISTSNRFDDYQLEIEYLQNRISIVRIYYQNQPAVETWRFSYVNDNDKNPLIINKSSEYNGDGIEQEKINIRYTYENSGKPIFHDINNLWSAILLMGVVDDEFWATSNIIKKEQQNENSSSISVYNFEYGLDGYPVKRTTTGNNSYGETYTDIQEYFYNCK
jgi:hypothetical protein